MASSAGGGDTNAKELPHVMAADLDSHPSTVALIEDYLRPWVASGCTAAPAAPYVHVADVYSAEPWELAWRFASAVTHKGERAWYFLTRLRLIKTVRDPRFVRKVDTGVGWWHSESKEQPVVDDVLGGGRRVGRRQFFHFRKMEGEKNVRTGWIMWKFRLDVDIVGRSDRDEELCVLCKVYRSPRHPAWPGDVLAAVEEQAVVDGPEAEDDESASETREPGEKPADDDDVPAESVATSPALEDENSSCLAALLALVRDEEPANDDFAAESFVAAPALEDDNSFLAELLALGPDERPANDDASAEKSEDENSCLAALLALVHDEKPPNDDASAEKFEDENSCLAALLALVHDEKPANDDAFAEKFEAAPALQRDAAPSDDSSAAPRKRKRAADGNPSGSAAGPQHCLRCGFHLDAAQAAVDPDLETGESSQRKNRTFYHFI